MSIPMVIYDILNDSSFFAEVERGIELHGNIIDVEIFIILRFWTNRNPSDFY
jgi:hypothetical protein